MANIKVASIDKNNNGGFVIVLNADNDNFRFVQSELCTQAGLAVTPYGALIYDGTPRSNPGASDITIDAIDETGVMVALNNPPVTVSGNKLAVASGLAPGDTIGYEPVS